MITINANEAGVILAAGRGIEGVAYEGDIPDDFYQTFPTGKYTFLAGSLVTNNDWVPPAISLSTLP